MTAGVLSWNWQGLVINPSVPCTVSPLLRAGWTVPTVKFRLKQKALAGKAYTHGPRRSFPDTSAVVMSGREEWGSRGSPLKPPAAEPKCLPRSTLVVKLHRSWMSRWKAQPCLWLSSPRSIS